MVEQWNCPKIQAAGISPLMDSRTLGRAKMDMTIFNHLHGSKPKSPKLLALQLGTWQILNYNRCCPGDLVVSSMFKRAQPVQSCTKLGHLWLETHMIFLAMTWDGSDFHVEVPKERASVQPPSYHFVP